MEKTSPLIEFKQVEWANFTFAARDSLMLFLDDGWKKLTEPFPLEYISIPIYKLGEATPDFLREVETWCCCFYKWKVPNENA